MILASWRENGQIALARDADLLFIESTFLDEHRERALEKRHLTAKQAGELVRAASAKQVIPFHFSPIYREEEQRIHEELALAFRGPLPGQRSWRNRHACPPAFRLHPRIDGQELPDQPQRGFRRGGQSLRVKA